MNLTSSIPSTQNNQQNNKNNNSNNINKNNNNNKNKNKVDYFMQILVLKFINLMWESVYVKKDSY